MLDGWVHLDWLRRVILWPTVPMTVKWNPSKRSWVCSIHRLHLYWTHTMWISSHRTMLHLGLFANSRPVDRSVSLILTVWLLEYIMLSNNNAISNVDIVLIKAMCPLLIRTTQPSQSYKFLDQAQLIKLDTTCSQPSPLVYGQVTIGYVLTGKIKLLSRPHQVIAWSFPDQLDSTRPIPDHFPIASRALVYSIEFIWSAVGTHL